MQHVKISRKCAYDLGVNIFRPFLGIAIAWNSINNGAMKNRRNSRFIIRVKNKTFISA